MESRLHLKLCKRRYRSELIAYYSRRGQNLVNGTVKILQVGNTELAAAILQRFTGADMYRIEPCWDYPALRHL